jgi:23S rRNA (guanosine2251-2'-O)-methyltransferase
MRVYHKAYKKAQAKRAAATSPDAVDVAHQASVAGPQSTAGRAVAVAGTAGEWIIGRNPVVEALRDGVPVKALHVAERVARDDRIREAVRLATEQDVPLLECTRAELDRLTGATAHQGIAAQVPPYSYAHPDDLLEEALASDRPTLLVALDGVTDPRNLGAVVRSAAAFGAHGVVVPERRSAAMTAGAWKASAGAALRVPVARAVNLTRALRTCQREGLTVVGLDASGDVSLSEVEELAEPVVLVAGSEGKGLSRLVRETCDRLARIPIDSDVESLNAGVAVGIALYEVARRRGSA